MQFCSEFEIYHQIYVNVLPDSLPQGRIHHLAQDETNIFLYGHVPLIIEGMYMYIYILCILYVTYTYMTSKSLKDITVL